MGTWLEPAALLLWPRRLPTVLWALFMHFKERWFHKVCTVSGWSLNFSKTHEIQRFYCRGTCFWCSMHMEVACMQILASGMVQEFIGGEKAVNQSESVTWMYRCCWTSLPRIYDSMKVNSSSLWSWSFFSTPEYTPLHWVLIVPLWNPWSFKV